MYGKVCIGDTSLRNNMPKYTKPISNRNNITRGCKTCIIAILLQSDLNKQRLLKLAKLDTSYINSESTRLLKRSNIDLIDYKNQIFTNNSHIHLRACDAASSYNFPYPFMGPNITKWDCILNFCSDFPGMNATYLESS